MQTLARRFALILFVLYAAVFPGSTLTVALDQVPGWGTWFGGALLALQGAMLLLWLAGHHGWRGLLAGLLIGTLGFAIEYAGVTTGFPFGRYSYTTILQPQVLGVVPLAICCAWMMVVPSSFAIAQRIIPPDWGARAPLLVTATLVLLLDLQIETVASHINHYWLWQDHGPFYGVPTANFVAWWLTGLAMAWVLAMINGHRPVYQVASDGSARHPRRLAGIMAYTTRHIPILLYLLNTLMFAVINLAYGYTIAGLLGVAVLLVAGVLASASQSGGIGMRGIMRRISG